jgi:hypothetical protein
MPQDAAISQGGTTPPSGSHPAANEARARKKLLIFDSKMSADSGAALVFDYKTSADSGAVLVLDYKMNADSGGGASMISAEAGAFGRMAHRAGASVKRSLAG